MANPGRTIRDPSDAVELIRALWAVRDAADFPDAAAVMGSGRPGSLILGLARTPHLLRVFRRMETASRNSMVADWQNGLRVLDREITRLRGMVRRRPPIPRAVRRAWRFLLGDGIDITLFALAIAALGIALWRSQR